MNVRCSFCGRETAERYAYREVRGFERTSRGGAGGTNALRLRVPSEVFACPACIELESGRRGRGGPIEGQLTF